MRYTKKIILAIMVIATLTLATTNIFAIVSPTSNFYINDYANILSDETESYVLQKNVTLNNQSGAQIVVVTVDNLEGRSLESYANQLFRNFGIGDKDKNNGILILLSLQDRKCRIEVGYGLEGILPDGKTGRLQDEYMIPYFKENKFDDGIRNGFNAILDIVAVEYNVNMEKEQAVVVGSSNEKQYNYSMFPLFIFAIISMIAGRNIHKKRQYKDKDAKLSIVKTVVSYIIIMVGAFIVIKFIMGYPIWYMVMYAIINPFIFIFNIFSIFGGPFSGGGFYGGFGRWQFWRLRIWRFLRAVVDLLVAVVAQEDFKIK